MADIFIDEEQIEFPGETFQLVSDISLDAPGSSSRSPSYSVEYTANGGRGGIRHLLADTFKINDTRSYLPSPSSNDVFLPNDYFCGREVSTDQEEFISIDIQPYIASDISENGSTIKNYTTFWSRPEMWRVTDNGPELYEVTNIENVKHFRALPFDDVRMYESVWPGTQVGTATGTINSKDKRTIFEVIVPGDISFSGQPTGCAGIDWSGFTQVYRGDLIHDTSTGATDTVIIPRNTRIADIGSNTISLSKDHTYVGEDPTTIQFTIRRIGPSAINREYGYYFRHYDFEDPLHAYNGLIINRPDCLPGSPGYWQGENQHETGAERYALDHQFLSEYTYAFYYGKVPDGHYKRVYGVEDDPTLDVNGNLRYDYNSNGRWGVYIDDEVKNYFEGRILVGHNIGIGIGNTHQPDPIVSIFNNKWKNQQDEIDSGSTGNCIGPTVTDPNDFMQFQMGLFVEDIVGIGTRIDTRYRLNVDASENSVGIARTTVEKAARFVGGVEIVGEFSIISSPGGGGGTVVGFNSSGINITGVTTSSGGFVGDLTGNEVTASGITLTSRKAFDIQHPNKPGWRLRHICLEGPESAVYYRGRLTNSNFIKFPDYWVGLVDPETITVSLTQIGSSQDLIVEKIEYDEGIVIQSGTKSNIDCYFLIYGERIDGEKLTVEYEGNQYPGDNSQYSINK